MNPGILTDVLNAFLDAFRLGYGRIMPDARWLLQTLALIEIVLAALWWTFRREDALVAFLQRLLWVGFFIFLVTEWPRLVGALLDSFAMRLLLDSGVVDLTMSYNPLFVILSSSESLFFKGLKNELRSLGNMEAEDPGIQQERNSDKLTMPTVAITPKNRLISRPSHGAS